jgi:glycerophosphoryl diester phosphodiesterase
MNHFKLVNYWKVALTIVVLTVFSCDKQEDWILDVPIFTTNSKLLKTTVLSDNAKYALEGIYKVTLGADMFGDTLVVKQTRDKISIFGYKNGCYFILGNGSVGSEIILEGYWRCALNDKTGLVSFSIPNADNLIQGDTSLTTIQFSGSYGNGQANPQNALECKRIEKFSPRLRADPFIIGAHRAGGRTSDKLPVSENSVAMINYTEYFGSTGIEIDVTLTKDKIPVLYHDEDLNIRLIQKGPLFGSIHDYTFSQLRSLVKLIHGEDIPSLEEAFKAVVNNTNLKFVWLDIKDAESLTTVIPLQIKYVNLAKKAGKNLHIFVGVPSDDVYNAFLSYPDYQNVESLCELSEDKVATIQAKAWAFRWTMGLQEQEVVNMHSQGRKCLVWTLDVPEFTKIYTTQGGTDATRRFDGILTNYPSILAYYHYVRHNF